MSLKSKASKNKQRRLRRNKGNMKEKSRKWRNSIKKLSKNNEPPQKHSEKSVKEIRLSIIITTQAEHVSLEIQF